MSTPYSMMHCLLVAAIVAMMTAMSFAAPPAADAAKPPPPRKGPLKIVCLGDSITQGFGLVDANGKQAMNALGYPAKLGTLLGPQAVAHSVGAGGTSYFRKAPFPYEKAAWKGYVELWKPDVVLLAFGTNCSNDNSWPKLHDQYPDDVRWLIGEVRKISPGVEIYICLPPPAYSNLYGINEKSIREGVIPALKKIAEEDKLNTIDFHTALSNHPELFPDTIHPNEEGMRVMARTIAERLYETRKDLVRPAAPQPAK